MAASPNAEVPFLPEVDIEIKMIPLDIKLCNTKFTCIIKSLKGLIRNICYQIKASKKAKRIFQKYDG
jgi:hypothetical protein